MLEAISQIYRLKNAVGSIKKMEILREFKGNESFRNFLYYALNPMLTYKISENTLRKKVEYDPAITLTMTDIFSICETLANRKALDNTTVYQVCAFLQNLCTPEESEFFIKLLAKTLRLGVTAKTVNKVIPGLIPEWEVQQAYPIEKYPVKDNTEIWLTEKLNGVRATYYKGKLYARSGVPFEGLEHITNILERFDRDAGNTMVLDGELTLKEKGGLSDNEAFRITTGVINSSNDDKTTICYTIFDVLPASEFEKGQSRASYRDRRVILDYIQSILPEDSSVLILPVLYHGTDVSKIDVYLDEMVREDKEGLMLNLNVPYKCKRHNGILKVKRFYTMDLRIIGCEEGTGRLAGTLGSLVVDYKGNEVRVGSGFTDEQRNELWKNRESTIGLLCEVKYKEISYDKTTGAESLQFPVFVTIRTDKDDISYA